MIKKTIKKCNWVEGLDISWEFKSNVNEYLVPEVKELVPICNKDKQRCHLNGTNYICSICGRQISINEKTQKENLIINNLKDRIRILNEPLDKPSSQSGGRHFSGVIYD